MNKFQELELLAHTAWKLSGMSLVISLNSAVRILSYIEDELLEILSKHEWDDAYRFEDFYGIYHIEIKDLRDWYARISSQAHWAKRRLEMSGETVAEKVRENQDAKEMTRRAIELLEKLNEDVDDLREEFFKIYGEKV